MTRNLGPSIGPLLEITSIVFIFPTVITTVLRLWVRIRNKNIGPDDYTMAVSAVLAIVMSAISIQAVKDGKGHHQWRLSEHQQEEIGKYSWINQIVLFCAICMIKTSICLLILRIQDSRWLKIVIYTTITFLAITNLIPIIALCHECSPVYGFWRRTAPGVICRSPDFRIYSIWVQSAYSILTDLTCSILPVIIVWQLQMSRKKKIGVCLLMSVGLVCTAFAALRATSLSTNITDTTWTYTYTGTWMTIELNLGILAANIAPLRSVIFKLFPRMKSTNNYSYDTNAFRSPRRNLTGSHDPYEGYAIDAVNGQQRQRLGSFTSDRSQIPLKNVVHTTEVICEAPSSKSSDENVARR